MMDGDPFDLVGVTNGAGRGSDLGKRDGRSPAGHDRQGFTGFSQDSHRFLTGNSQRTHRMDILDEWCIRGIGGKGGTPSGLLPGLPGIPRRIGAYGRGGIHLSVRLHSAIGPMSELGRDGQAQPFLVGFGGVGGAQPPPHPNLCSRNYVTLFNVLTSEVLGKFGTVATFFPGVLFMEIFLNLHACCPDPHVSCSPAWTFNCPLRAS